MGNMPDVQKFLFDTQFDAPPPPPPPIEEEVVPEEPLPPPPPTFSEEELEMARRNAHQHGYNEGLLQGRAEAQSGNEKLLAEQLHNVGVQVAALMEMQSTQGAAQRQLALQISLTLMQKLLPAYTARHGLQEIEAVVAGMLGELMREPHLALRVSDQMLEPVSAIVEKEVAALGYTGRLVFLADPSMGPSDCRLEWADGGLQRDETRLWQEVDHLVAQVLQLNAAPASPPDIPETPTTQIES